MYVSEDQVFSEPILKDFEKETGIKVKAVYDTEEAKSTGAMNRLIAEKDNPQADVYWANEPIRRKWGYYVASLVMLCEFRNLKKSSRNN